MINKNFQAHAAVYSGKIGLICDATLSHCVVKTLHQQCFEKLSSHPLFLNVVFKELDFLVFLSGLGENFYRLSEDLPIFFKPLKTNL